MKLNHEQKTQHKIIGNKLDNAYIIYNNITPAIRTTQILNETIQLWQNYKKNIHQQKQNKRQTNI